jgi:hypothetical protein
LGPVIIKVGERAYDDHVEVAQRRSCGVRLAGVAHEPLLVGRVVFVAPAPERVELFGVVLRLEHGAVAPAQERAAVARRVGEAAQRRRRASRVEALRREAPHRRHRLELLRRDRDRRRSRPPRPSRVDADSRRSVRAASAAARRRRPIHDGGDGAKRAQDDGA